MSRRPDPGEVVLERPVQAAVGSPRAALTAAPPSRPRVQAAQERSLVRDHVVALELPRWARVGREPGLLRGREEPDLLGKRVDAFPGNHPQLIHGAPSEAARVSRLQADTGRYPQSEQELLDVIDQALGRARQG